jgi:hypothetical protein
MVDNKNDKNDKNEFGKIPIPWADTKLADKRLEYCLVYWHMMKAWNGREPFPMYIVSDVIDDTNLILSNIDPRTVLAQRVFDLRSDVVTFGTKNKKEKVVKLKERARNRNDPNDPNRPGGKLIVL